MIRKASTNPAGSSTTAGATSDMTARIVRSDPAQLAEFRGYWQAAIEFQARHGYPSSPVFPEALLLSEMQGGRHFAGVRADGVCTGFFSLTLTDEPIWGERERGDAVYVHRMCSNPAVRGSALASAVLLWARQHARSLGRNFVRMDTWAANRRLVDYYVACGYRYIGDQPMGHDPRLSAHYHGIDLALFENPA